MNAYWADLPQCCRGCKYCGDDVIDIDYGPSYYYCMRGLFLPTQKQTCKVRNAG